MTFVQRGVGALCSLKYVMEIAKFKVLRSRQDVAELPLCTGIRLRALKAGPGLVLLGRTVAETENLRISKASWQHQSRGSERQEDTGSCSSHIFSPKCDPLPWEHTCQMRSWHTVFARCNDTEATGTCPNSCQELVLPKVSLLAEKRIEIQIQLLRHCLQHLNPCSPHHLAYTCL